MQSGFWTGLLDVICIITCLAVFCGLGMRVPIVICFWGVEPSLSYFWELRL